MGFQWYIMDDRAGLKMNMKFDDKLMYQLVIISSGGGFSFHTMTPIPL